MAEMEREFGEFVRSWQMKIALVEERYKGCSCKDPSYLTDKAYAYEKYSKELVAVIQDYFSVINNLHADLSKISSSSSGHSSSIQSPVSDRSEHEHFKAEFITLRCVLAERMDEEKQAKESLIEVHKYMDWLEQQNKKLYNYINGNIRLGNNNRKSHKQLIYNANEQNQCADEKLPNLTDSEIADESKVATLEESCKEITRLLKDKHEQIREQQRYIVRLRGELEKARADRPTDNINNQLTELKAENDQLIIKLNSQTSMLASFTETQSQLKQFKDLSLDQMQQINLSNKQIDVLKKEKQNLKEIYIKMVNSIKICNMELEPYTRMSKSV